jgi:hypothetical protein
VAHNVQPAFADGGGAEGVVEREKSFGVEFPAFGADGYQHGIGQRQGIEAAEEGGGFLEFFVAGEPVALVKGEADGSGKTEYASAAFTGGR